MRKSYTQGFSAVEQAPSMRGTQNRPLTHTIKMIVFYPIFKIFFLTCVNKPETTELILNLF